MRSLVAIGVVLVVIVAGLIVLALYVGSLGSDGGDSDAVKREPLTIVTTDGEIFRLEVEVADTQEERSVGLSGREEVPEDTGMLFIIPERGPGFWMKDTQVPLSVAFLAECGEIVDIQQMEPLSLEIHQSDEDYSFGLETPQGWFTANGVEVGDLVSIPRNYRPDVC